MPVTIDLTGRTALVTGGAGGLGFACARALADAGADVVLSDLESPRLSRAAAELGAAARPADLTDRAQAAALVDGLDRLDVLVNCAGIMRTTPLLDIEPGEWLRVVDVNLNATFWLTQAAGRRMAGQGAGSIVTLASVAARSGRPNAAHYSASKTALLSLTRSAAEALAPVRVNAVCPGVVLTPHVGGDHQRPRPPLRPRGRGGLPEGGRRALAAQAGGAARGGGGGGVVPGQRPGVVRDRPGAQRRRRTGDELT
ncbi:SDR family oxidoreductase [Nonomuraea salmonea]|uniref:SDR family NAD(P)-dependent oxidoreductase n=1 Tax=Nonomuraea salmonea TaxID=46181 RepID=UPI002FEDADCF